MASSLLSANKVAPNRPTWTTDYVRPADWLAMPTVLATEQKVVMLCSVRPEDRNFLSFRTVGATTVDWGDGSAPVNFGNNVQAEKNLLWANAPANTLTSEGFRQVIVTITAQAGQSLSQFFASLRPTGFAVGYIQPHLEIALSLPNVTAAGLSSDQDAISGARWVNWVGTTMLTGAGSVFRGARFLRGITGTQWCATATTFDQCFLSCASLQTVPALSTANATSMLQMFQGCSNIKTLPLFNTSNVTNFQSMVAFCSALQAFPACDMAKATTTATMFSTCSSLVMESGRTLNTTALLTQAQGMFQSCGVLVEAPMMNTSMVTSASNLLASCFNLTTVPLYDLSKATNLSSFMTGCSRIRFIPQFDFSAATVADNCFSNCSSLEIIDIPTTSLVNNWSNFILNAIALRVVKVNLSASPSAPVNFFNSPGAWESVILTGLRYSGSVANARLSAAALDAMYSSLGTAAGAQTITVTGNPGVAGDTPSIATAKGFTVVGS